MAIKNSDLFLTAFNRIETYLKREEGNAIYINFTDIIRTTKKSNPVVRRYEDDLIELAYLRNAIVHKKTDAMYAIAEPHETIVKKIEMIEEKLTAPKLVYPTFNRPVQMFQINDTLSTMLEVVNEKSFSQFPIYDDHLFKGLITGNGLTNWLAKNVEDDYLSRNETHLKEILLCEEDGANYSFISRDTSVYEAVDIFTSQMNKGRRLEALLITHNGRPTETLLGIITSWDIIDIS